MLSTLKRWIRGGKTRTRKTKRPERRFRPSVEALEGRLVPSVFQWEGTVSRDWSELENWSVGGQSTEVLPGESDSVLIAADVTAERTPQVPAGHAAVAKSITFVGSVSTPRAFDIEGSLRLKGATTDWNQDNWTIGYSTGSGDHRLELDNAVLKLRGGGVALDQAWVYGGGGALKFLDDFNSWIVPSTNIGRKPDGTYSSGVLEVGEQGAERLVEHVYSATTGFWIWGNGSTAGEMNFLQDQGCDVAGGVYDAYGIGVFGGKVQIYAQTDETEKQIGAPITIDGDTSVLKVHEDAYVFFSAASTTIDINNGELQLWGGSYTRSYALIDVHGSTSRITAYGAILNGVDSVSLKSSLAVRNNGRVYVGDDQTAKYVTLTLIGDGGANTMILGDCNIYMTVSGGTNGRCSLFVVQDDISISTSKVATFVINTIESAPTVGFTYDVFKWQGNFNYGGSYGTRSVTFIGFGSTSPWEWGWHSTKKLWATYQT